MKPLPPASPYRHQRGVVLFVALIALVAMTLAGIALVRSMDTGLVISGNLAFKQATLNIAERGTEQAIAWLQANATTIRAADPHKGELAIWYDDALHGYYSTYVDVCDLTDNVTTTGATSDEDGVNWKDDAYPGGIHPVENCGMTGVVVAGMPPGYSASYVINRMCAIEGKPGSIAESGGTVTCAQYQGSSDQYGFSTKRGAHYPDKPLPATLGRYFRVTTRVLGPRNTVSYSQALVGM